MLAKLKTLVKPLAKALTWRLIAVVEGLIVAWLITGKLGAALSLVGIGSVTHTVMYVAHERAWARYA